MKKVESFELDHRNVIAPYVRKAAIEKGELGDIVSKFDLRLVQPNEEEIPTAAMHTLEHLLATYLREELKGLIDISPMGCRTGFYLIIWGNREQKEIRDALKNSLEKVINTTKVPATNEIQCGNYRDHSLFAAIEYAKKILSKDIRIDFLKK